MSKDTEQLHEVLRALLARITRYQQRATELKALLEMLILLAPPEQRQRNPRKKK